MQEESQKLIQKLQQDYEDIKANLIRVFNAKILQYQKFIELEKINEDLSHRSIEKMKEFG